MAKPTPKTKRLIRDRTRLEIVLIILLIIVIYLLLAALKDWWPSNTHNPHLGTAFYSSEQAIDDGNARAVPNTDKTNTGGSNGGGSGNTGGGSNNGGGSGGGGNGGGTSSSSPLLDFAANVDTGNSKQEISGQANGLNESCAVVAKATTAGKQEVCVYTEGDKVVTVTYLNDRVISASRSGF